MEYSRRRVLVTGGLGYIGWNLTAALLDHEAIVTVLTANRSRHRTRAGHVEVSGAAVIQADIRDADAMGHAVRDQDVVFHLAGRSGAVHSVDDPAGDYDINCGGSLTILQAVRTHNPDATLVFSSSRLVYGAPRALPVSESHAIEPRCPHGLHKATAERYIAIYGRLYGLRATSLRITNPYGPGQPRDRSAYGVVNFLMHRALAGLSLPLYGSGAQLRDYVYIGDVVSALLAAGSDSRADGQIYNVGSGVGIRMIDAARQIVDAVGAGCIESNPWPAIAEQIESGDFVADITRIERDLGWRPTVSFGEGLRRTVDAYLGASTDA